jgi:hypothetical protein
MTNSAVVVNPAGQIAVDNNDQPSGKQKLVLTACQHSDVGVPPEQPPAAQRRKYVRGQLDPVLAGPRVLEQLLHAESLYGATVRPNYLYTRPGPQHSTAGGQITAAMRTAAADWMALVVEEQGCAAQVLLLAVQYLDRLLAAAAAIQLAQLQLAAAAALFVASKLCELRPLCVQTLLLYMDEAEVAEEDVGPADILDMEELLLDRLRWDLAGPTSLDFLRLLEPRYEELTTRVVEPVTRLLLRAAREYQFCAVRPSVLAAAAFLTAIQTGSCGEGETTTTATVVPMHTARWKHLHTTLANLLNIDKVKT